MRYVTVLDASCVTSYVPDASCFASLTLDVRIMRRVPGHVNVFCVESDDATPVDVPT